MCLSSPKTNRWRNLFLDLGIAYPLSGPFACLPTRSKARPRVPPRAPAEFIHSLWIRFATDGTGGISQGQSASITARATAPDLTPTQVVLKLLSTCPCPLGSIFDKHCDCGCGTQPDLALPAQYSEGPFLPLCGTTCCKMGEQCQQPQNMCGLSSPSAGSRLLKPEAPRVPR
jgi:hypothetical protein